MAINSPTQQINTLTPPSSSHGESRPWDYAVPISSENLRSVDDRSYDSNDNSKPAQSRSHLVTQPNGFSNLHPRRVDTSDSQRSSKPNQNTEVYLAPSRVNQLSRKPSDTSAASSEADSLLDLYKQPESRQPSRTMNKQQNNKRKLSQGPNGAEDDIDDSNWIHRDKLAQIESEELKEAGIHVGGVSPSNTHPTSDMKSGQDPLQSRSANGLNGRGSMATRYSKKDEKRIYPTYSPEPLIDSDGEPIDFEFRTPEEVAAERDKENAPRSIRPSTSRIPIAKTSPVPVPHNFIERDSPLPRSRNGSGAWSGSYDDPLLFHRPRNRSQSVGSQVLLDDTEESGVKTPIRNNEVSPQTSPPKAKVPTKPTPTSGPKKTNTPARATSGQTKQRAASKESPGKRPGTSGGTTRPSTAINRPEGEAPWLATMYKPDPRLPPDQQVIPTHAKRMMQEKWEKEGKTGSTFDKDFRLLNDEDLSRFSKRQSQIQPEAPKMTEDEEKATQWPLTGAKPTASNGQSELQSPTHGGYKTIPTISSPQFPPGSRAASRAVSRAENPTSATGKPAQPIQVQEQVEPEKQKGGCGCCIVM